jgi:hypothetical protein
LIQKNFVSNHPGASRHPSWPGGAMAASDFNEMKSNSGDVDRIPILSEIHEIIWKELGAPVRIDSFAQHQGHQKKWGGR